MNVLRDISSDFVNGLQIYQKSNATKIVRQPSDTDMLNIEYNDNLALETHYTILYNQIFAFIFE